YDQNLIIVRIELFRQLFLSKTVEHRFRIFLAIINDGARECDKRPDIVITLFADIGIKSLLVSQGMKSGTGHHHRFRPDADLVASDSPKMLDHHFSFLSQVVWMQAHKPGNGPFRAYPKTIISK